MHIVIPKRAINEDCVIHCRMTLFVLLFHAFPQVVKCLLQKIFLVLTLGVYCSKVGHQQSKSVGIFLKLFNCFLLKPVQAWFRGSQFFCLHQSGLQFLQIFRVFLLIFAIHQTELILHAGSKPLEIALLDPVNNIIG